MCHTQEGGWGEVSMEDGVWDIMVSVQEGDWDDVLSVVHGGVS